MNDYVTENELVYKVRENDEDAKNLLYEKYSYIIDIILSKYKKAIYALGLDFNEIKQEALVGFSDALIKYVTDKNSSLATFISLVVERKVQNCIRKGETHKNKVLSEAYSLEYDNDGLARPLNEIIGDSSNDPLTNIAQQESYQELTKKINSFLSPFELDVYNLLINDFNYIEIAKILGKEPKQIDNTIQRIRSKIKEII